MPKTRQQKEDILVSLQDRLERAQSVVFVSTVGVKVGEIEEIREALFPHGLQLQVAKNSLLRRALAEQKVAVPAELLDQPLALVYAYDDIIAGPKLLLPFSKDIEALQILGGIVEGSFITPAQVTAYAKLPSRDELLGRLVGTLQAPLAGMVNVLAGNLRGLVTVLAAIRDTQPSA